MFFIHSDLITNQSIRYRKAKFRYFVSVKNESEAEREKNLHDQLLTWSEELSSVHVPSPDSGIPGAIAHG
jgi:hypothetical protein